MSYASMGANILFNLMRRENILMVAEGLNILRIELPESLENKPLLESAIREKSGCSVIAIRRDGKPIMTPSPDFVLRKNDILLLIGTVDAEDRFLEIFVKNA
jgi:voltage-gated potassium channel